MSKFHELIGELCPDGVEYRKLGDVADIGTGSSNTQDQDPNGIYPFYVRSPEVKRSNGFEFDETAIVTAGDGEVGKVFHFVEGKYALHQRAYRAKPTNSTLDAKFLYHYMKANFRTYVERKACSATVKSLRKPMFQSFEIPVPPIEVQREIVRTLDAFTELETNLEEELEARKAQYAYYRDCLLSMENLEAMDGKPVEMRELQDLAEIGTGSSNTQDQEPEGIYPFYVRSPEVKRSNSFEYDETAIVTAGDGDVGKVFHYVEGKYALHQRAYRVRVTDSSLDSKFLFYYMKANFRSYVERKACSATVKSLRKPMFQKFEIPVPSLATQQEVVGILDRFDSLTTSLTDGLPAEIEVRRRQYEYYRDRLLDFLRKEAAAS